MSAAVAQDTLTIDDAVSQALKNSFMVLTSKNKTEIAAINNSPGNAGMLPKATASITGSEGRHLIDQHQPGGAYSNIATSAAPSVAVTFTLFDGFKMFATKSQLQKLQEIGEINFKDTLQSVAALVMNAYYDIVSSVQQLKGLDTARGIAREQVAITEKKVQIGTASDMELLQAKVNFNEQTSMVLVQENLVQQKKIALNVLLARSPDIDFVTCDSIPINVNVITIPFSDLETHNMQLIAASKNVEAAKFAKSVAQSQFWPTLSISGGYGFNHVQNSASNPHYNQTSGLSGTVALTIPLFNGYNTVNQVRVASLNLANSQIGFENAKLQIKSKMFQVQSSYERAKKVLKLEEENIGLANMNLKIALERFRLGQSTIIEMQTIGQNYVNVLSRLVSARFAVKSYETELLRIQGGLVK
jgi:outer membrane protein TolC